MSELRETFRCANIALAVTLPVFFAGGILLRNAGELANFILVVAIFALMVAITLVLDERARRRRERDQ